MRKRERWYLFLGLFLLGSIVAVALLAGHITAVSPDYRDRNAYVMQGTPPFPPSSRHLMGTDPTGRDIWSRVAYGARWSLLFAGMVALMRLAIALPLGMQSAFGSRPIRWLTERLYAFTSSFPLLFLYLLLLSGSFLRLLGLWPSAVITGVVLTILEWPRIAIWVKGRTEHLLREPFVEGAVAAGATRSRIFWRHLFPHLWPSVVQMAARELSRSLLVLAELGIFRIMMGGGYLDQIEQGTRLLTVTVAGVPEWGGMLADGKSYALTAPWTVLAPGVAFLWAITGANLVAMGWGQMPPTSAGATDSKWRAVINRWWRTLVAGVTVVALLLVYHPWSPRTAATPCAAADAMEIELLGKKVPSPPVTVQRGYHVDVAHHYNPNVTSLAAVGPRQQVAYLATAADRAFEQMVSLLGDPASGQRPIVKLFLNDDTYVLAMRDARGAEAANQTIGLGANGCIYVSPAYLATKDATLAQRAIGMELGKSMVRPDEMLSPIATGLLVRGTEDRPGFRVDYKKMPGAPLLSLPELFSQTPATLEAGRQASFMVQSNIVVEFLKQWLTDDQLLQLSRERAGLADVARKAGLDEAGLSARYTREVFALVAGESVMTGPVVYNRIPKALEDAVRGSQAADRLMLDAEINSQRATVYVVDPTSGRTEAQVINSQRATAWVLDRTGGRIEVHAEAWELQGNAWVRSTK